MADGKAKTKAKGKAKGKAKAKLPGIKKFGFKVKASSSPEAKASSSPKAKASPSPTVDAVATSPRRRQSQKGPSLKVHCYDCKSEVDKDDCQKQGRASNPLYLCNPCNRRNQKVKSILQQFPAMNQEWSELTKEEKQNLKESLKNTSKEATKEKMVAHLTHSKINRSITSKGTTNKPLPLSVLQQMGYSTSELEAIQKNCEKEWNAETDSYNYIVAQKQSSYTDAEEVKNELLRKPKSEKKASEKKASSTSSTSSSSSSSDEDSTDSSNTPKPMELEKNVTKAKKLVGGLTVLMCRSEAWAHGLKCQGIEERIPSYMIEEMQLHRANVDKFHRYWKSVLGGNFPQADPSCLSETVEAAMKEMESCFSRAEMMLKHAFESLDKSKQKEDDKQKKDGKSAKEKKDGKSAKEKKGGKSAKEKKDGKSAKEKKDGKRAKEKKIARVPRRRRAARVPRRRRVARVPSLKASC